MSVLSKQGLLQTVYVNDLTNFAQHRYDKSMENEEESVNRQKTPERMVIYKPDQLGYQTLHLCIYLRELPELNSEDIEKDR